MADATENQNKFKNRFFLMRHGEVGTMYVNVHFTCRLASSQHDSGNLVKSL